MYGHRYFGKRYFPEVYFSGIGTAAPPPFTGDDLTRFIRRRHARGRRA